LTRRSLALLPQVRKVSARGIGLRVQSHGAFEVVNALVQASLKREQQSQIVVRLAVLRIQCDRLRKVLRGFHVGARRGQSGTNVPMGAGIARIQLQGPAEFLYRPFEVTSLCLCEPEDVVRPGRFGHDCAEIRASSNDAPV
jgi:hypothetical protein